MLSYNETVPSAVTGAEEDERGGEFIEDLRRLRQHKRIERNRKLAAQAKRAHGTQCQVCRLDFGTVYGPVGDGYIEAHHLTPLAELKGQRLRLDPRRDFAVLCANCHRMVHKSALPHDLDAFRQVHYRSSGLRRVAERSPGYNVPQP